MSHIIENFRLKCLQGQEVKIPRNLLLELPQVGGHKIFGRVRGTVGLQQEEVHVGVQPSMPIPGLLRSEPGWHDRPAPVPNPDPRENIAPSPLITPWAGTLRTHGDPHRGETSWPVPRA